jgi:integrase
MLCWTQGARQHAVLHLQWRDIDLDARRITWRAAWDKVGRERAQPLREPAIAALTRALAHRERLAYSGPWVFPAGSTKSAWETYSIQSLWAALMSAERRSGVEHKRQRGGHGLRRLLTGDVNALTGDPMLALHAIGDTDARQAARYIVPREDRIKAAFEGLDRALIPAVPARDGNESATERETMNGGADND